MYFRCAAKSLSIAGRAVLALALAIGASGAMFSGGGLRFTPFFDDDAQIEDAAVDTTGRADSTGADLQKGNQSKGANTRPDARNSDHSGKARPKRAKGIMLSADRFILDSQLESEQDGFDSAAAGFLVPGGLNSW
jgi:hypothetical protein